jgi:O-antigen/teichoic acid export membrane protein
MSSLPTAATSGTVPSLKSRVVRAGGWSLAGYSINQAIRFGSSLIMTRLLAPEMFGVMAIAVTLMVGLQMFSDLGLRQTIVQSRRAMEPAFLNTAWTLQVLRGVALWCAALLASLALHVLARSGLVPAGSVYASPELPAVVAVLSAGAFIAGFDSTKMIEATRRLALAGLTYIEIAAQVAGLAFMLAWSLIDRSIWALVGGSLATALTRTLLTHLWLPGVRNRWRLDRGALGELIGFGKWVFAASILGFLVNNGDRIMLGALMSAAALGAYSIALLAFGAVEQILAKIVNDVSFAALSEVARERPGQLRRACYRFHMPVAAAAGVAAGFLAFAGHDVMRLLYDRRYDDAGWMLQILALALLAIPSRIGATAFLAVGLPRLHTYIIAVRLVALVALLPLGFAWAGAHGAVWGIAASHFAVVPVTMFFQARQGLLDPRKELVVVPAFALSAVLAILLTRFIQ